MWNGLLFPSRSGTVDIGQIAPPKWIMGNREMWDAMQVFPISLVEMIRCESADREIGHEEEAELGEGGFHSLSEGGSIFFIYEYRGRREVQRG